MSNTKKTAQPPYLRKKGKFNDEVIGKLIEAFSIASTVSGACAYAGIHPTTYYSWYNRGAEDYEAEEKTDFAEFYLKIEQAKHIWESKALQAIIKAAEDDPEQWKWLLSRRKGRDYSTQQNVKAEIDGEMTVNHKDNTVHVMDMLAQIQAGQREVPADTDEDEPEK